MKFKSSAKSKKQNYSTQLLLVLLVVAGCLGTISYLAYRSKNIVNKVANNSVVTADKIQKTDWKTYSNEKLGITFQYPDHLDDNLPQVSVVNLENTKDGVQITSMPDWGIGFSITKDKTVDQKIKELNTRMRDANEIKDLGTTKIDGYDARHLVYRYDMGDWQEYLIQRGKDTLEITPAFSVWFEPILSTVKFLNLPQTNNIDTQTFTTHKMAGLTFGSFILTYPSTWNATETYDSDIYEFNLSKNDYHIGISQRPSSGAICLFSDSPEPEIPVYNDLSKVDFIQFSNNTGLTFRRYVNQNGFSVCQKEQAGTYFVSPTDFGAISYSTPKNFDTKVLTEMDNILKTIKPVK